MDIKALEVKPDDVIVITANEMIDFNNAKGIYIDVAKQFPDNKTIFVFNKNIMIENFPKDVAIESLERLVRYLKNERD